MVFEEFEYMFHEETFFYDFFPKTILISVSSNSVSLTFTHIFIQIDASVYAK